MSEMSIRGYALHRRQLGLVGGTHEAVRKAIATGRITAGPGGIDSEVADAQWAARTRRPLTFEEIETLVFGDGLEAATDRLLAGLDAER